MSNMAACPDCGEQVSRKAENCPKCGRKLKGGFFERMFKGYLWFLLIVTVLVVGTCTVAMM